MPETLTAQDWDDMKLGREARELAERFGGQAELRSPSTANVADPNAAFQAFALQLTAICRHINSTHTSAHLNNVRSGDGTRHGDWYVTVTKSGTGYKRDLTFARSSSEEGLATTLGVSPERQQYFRQVVNLALAQEAEVAQTLAAANDRGDMSDAEWTAFVYALGLFVGRLGI